MNAYMRDLWVRRELIHGMLLRSFGSFLRYDNAFVHHGSGKSVSTLSHTFSRKT